MLHRRYFSLWDISKSDIEASIAQANLHHPTIKFTAETSDAETVFLDTVVYKGTRFKEKSILNAKTHFKKTETFLYTQKKYLSKEKPWESYEKNSLETTFEENDSNFKKWLIDRGYLQILIENLLSEIKSTERESKVLKQNNKEEKEILPFVTRYQPSVSTIKVAWMK